MKGRDRLALDNREQLLLAKNPLACILWAWTKLCIDEGLFL